MDIILAAAISFLVTLVLTPMHIKVFGGRGIVGEDRHKPDRPKVPEMGGIVVFLGIAVSYAFILLFGDAPLAAYALPSICIVFLVGVIDDIYAIRHRTKIVLLAFSAVPLLFYQDGAIDLSFMTVGYGAAYALVAIIGMIASSNLTNILEGFNGESIGLGVISTGFLIADSLVLGDETIAWLLSPVFGSLLAFLIFNKYPSKVFPGDTGTLLVGGSIGVSVILGGHALLGVIVLVPHIIEFFLKSRVRFSGVRYGPTQVDADGFLTPPPYSSVANTLTSRFRLKEKTLVPFIWAIGSLFGFFSFLLSYVLL